MWQVFAYNINNNKKKDLTENNRQDFRMHYRHNVMLFVGFFFFFNLTWINH